MSISIMTYCFRVPMGENHCSKSVLLKLADNASDEGRCWPSWGYLVEHTGYSRRAVAYAIKHLESIGFIRLEQRSGTSTVYYVDVEAIKKATPIDRKGHKSKAYAPVPEPTVDDPDDGKGCSSAEVAPPPVQSLHPTSAKTAPTPCNGCTQTIIESPSNPKVESKEFFRGSKRKTYTPEEMTDQAKKLYDVWTELYGSAPDKVAWWAEIKSGFKEHGFHRMRYATRSYLEDITPERRKFYTPKSFAKNLANHLPPPFMASIKAHSDMPDNEQRYYQLQDYNREYRLDDV